MFTFNNTQISMVSFSIRQILNIFVYFLDNINFCGQRHIHLYIYVILLRLIIFQANKTIVPPIVLSSSNINIFKSKLKKLIPR